MPYIIKDRARQLLVERPDALLDLANPHASAWVQRVSEFLADRAAHDSPTTPMSDRLRVELHRRGVLREYQEARELARPGASLRETIIHYRTRVEELERASGKSTDTKPYSAVADDQELPKPDGVCLFLQWVTTQREKVYDNETPKWSEHRRRFRIFIREEALTVEECNQASLGDDRWDVVRKTDPAGWAERVCVCALSRFAELAADITNKPIPKIVVNTPRAVIAFDLGDFSPTEG